MAAVANEILARNWWAVALRGVFSILFGILAFTFPGAMLLSFVIVFAAYMLVDGVLAIVAAVRAVKRRERWGLFVFEGILDLAAGAIAVLLPGLTVLMFVLLVAAWALVSGAVMLTAAFRLNVDHGRWWFALGGLASILYGAALIVAPLIGAVVLTWWIGAYAIVFGALMLVFAFRLRARHNDHGHGAMAPA